MASNAITQPPNVGGGIEVQATVILRIANLDTNELTALYTAVQQIINQFGGEFDVTTRPQPLQPS